MKIVFATNNAHKLQEVRQILGNRFDVVGLSDIGCTEDIPETADTLEATHCRRHATSRSTTDSTALPTTRGWKCAHSTEHLAYTLPDMQSSSAAEPRTTATPI